MAVTSTRAIVTALHGAVYRAGELLEIIKELDYKRFVDKGWEDHIPWWESP